MRWGDLLLRKDALHLGSPPRAASNTYKPAITTCLLPLLFSEHVRLDQRSNLAHFTVLNVHVRLRLGIEKQEGSSPCTSYR